VNNHKIWERRPTNLQYAALRHGPASEKFESFSAPYPQAIKWFAGEKVFRPGSKKQSGSKISFAVLREAALRPILQTLARILIVSAAVTLEICRTKKEGWLSPV
jgi:hypothetical protein